ncbi:MAG: hypothetical protein J3Q66DRAFT_388926 [Benniella sp.]|nr:MAG: hypothetical protein J3Q66DRAFT_388926 [Benniella sp.]
MSSMLKDLAVGLFLPVVGSFVNRYRQGNHKSVLFAAELSNECQDQSYQAYILSLDDTRPPIHLPIESSFPNACQDEFTDGCEIGWILEESPLRTAIPLHGLLQTSMLGSESSSPGNQGIPAHRNRKCALGFEVCIAEGCCGGAMRNDLGSPTLEQSQKVKEPPIVASLPAFEDVTSNSATMNTDRHEVPKLETAFNDLMINEESPSRQILVGAGANAEHVTTSTPLSRSAACLNLQALCATPTLEFGLSSSKIVLVDPPLPHSVNLIADPHRHMSQAACIVTEDPEVRNPAPAHGVNKEGSRGKNSGLHNKNRRNLAQAQMQERSKSVPDSEFIPSTLRNRRSVVSASGNIEQTTSVTPPPHHGEKHDRQHRSRQAHSRPNTYAATDGDWPNRKVRNTHLEGGVPAESSTAGRAHEERQAVVDDDLFGPPLGAPRGRVSRNTVTLAKAVRKRPKGYFEM